MKSHTKKHLLKKSEEDSKPKCFYENIRQKLANFKSNIKNHRNVVIPTSISLINLFIIIVFCIIWSAKDSNNLAQNYYIDILDENNTIIDCDLTESNGLLICTNKEIHGSFSKYDSVELIGAEANEGNFKYEFSYSIPNDFYETAIFNIEDFPNEKELSHLIGLYDKLLDKTVLSKEIRITYIFSENDKKLIDEAHTKWQEKKNREQVEMEVQNQTKTDESIQIINEIEQEETETKQDTSEKQANPENEFPIELKNSALNACYKKLYEETSITINQQPAINHNYWSGVPYYQTIVIDDMYKSLRVKCSYNWLIKTATSIDLEELPY